MKIILLKPLQKDNGRTIPANITVDIAKNKANELIEKGLAQLPQQKKEVIKPEKTK